MKTRFAFSFAAVALFLTLLATVSFGQATLWWAFAAQDGAYTPQPGNPERKAIMDAYRVAWKQGFGDESVQVVFVVNYLKVHRGWAYTTVTPQSPDGSQNYESESGLLRRRNGKWKLLDRTSGDRSDLKRMRMKYPAAPSDIFP